MSSLLDRSRPRPAAVDPGSPPVEVRTSARRRKTATAYWQNGRIVVVLPARTPPATREEVVERLVARVVDRPGGPPVSDAELHARAVELGRVHLDGVTPTSVRWSSTQHHRWGSCSVDSGAIRVSDRLRLAPSWVLDAVLVHELAHLREPGHGPAFRRLLERFPRHREADAFLEGFSLGLGAGPWLTSGPCP